MTAQELDELLQQVRMRGSMSNFFAVLNPEQRGAISVVLLPEINRLIEDARSEGAQ